MYLLIGAVKTTTTVAIVIFCFVFPFYHYWCIQCYVFITVIAKLIIILTIASTVFSTVLLFSVNGIVYDAILVYKSLAIETGVR